MWLIAMVNKSPKDRVSLGINGLVYPLNWPLSGMILQVPWKNYHEVCFDFSGVGTHGLEWFFEETNRVFFCDD